MNIPTLKPGYAIQIIWIDSHYNQEGWQSENDFISDRPGCTIKSVCQYVHHDDEWIYTVADRGADEGGDRGIMRDLKIPIVAIKSIRRLK